MQIYNTPDHTAYIQRTGYPLGADDNIVDQCEECEEGVNAGERMFLRGGRWVCRACFKDFLRIRIISDLESFAEALEISTKMAGE